MVFELLNNAIYHVKKTKCTIFTKNTEFLGHVVSSGGIAICLENTSAIRNWPQTSMIHDVKPFLGLCNYLRLFVKGFIKVAVPLKKLIKKATEFA